MYPKLSLVDFFSSQNKLSPQKESFITISFSALWKKIIGFGTRSCRFYKKISRTLFSPNLVTILWNVVTLDVVKGISECEW